MAPNCESEGGEGKGEVVDGRIEAAAERLGAQELQLPNQAETEDERLKNLTPAARRMEE